MNEANTFKTKTGYCHVLADKDGPSKKPNERKAILIFRDDEFVATLVGVYPENNIEKRNEILEIFKNIVYIKDFEVDPLELVNFEFDQSITNFKHAMTTSNFLTFNKDGRPESENDFPNSFNIGAMPKMSTEKSCAFINGLIRSASNSGQEFDSREIKVTKIGAYQAVILDTSVKDADRNGIIYISMLQGNESNVIFMGTAYSETATLLEKYKATVKTIKIK